MTFSLPDWKPASLPSRAPLRGRTALLEPLEARRHAGSLWRAIAGHDALWQWLFDGPFASEAEFARAVEAKEQAEGFRFYAIAPIETGEALGWASLMRAEAAHGAIEVGNILLAPRLQRTTAATEAMYLLARHVFEDLGYRRYEWKCNADNLPSRRAAERLGFTFEGVFRQHMVVKGANRDTAWFAMLDREWPARREAFEQWLASGNFDAEGRQRKPLGG